MSLLSLEPFEWGVVTLILVMVLGLVWAALLVKRECEGIGSVFGSAAFLLCAGWLVWLTGWGSRPPDHHMGQTDIDSLLQQRAYLEARLWELRAGQEQK